MATWSIEHIPASGGDPTIASLATWGFAGLQIQFENWGTDIAAITTRGGTIAFDAAQFEYKDKIVIWRDGVRFFQCWVTGLGLTAQAQESRTYTLSGPSWWLEHLPFTWPTWPAKEELSLGERASFRWIGFALDAAIAKGAPIAKDSGNYASFILPTPDIRASSNCLEVLQRVARLHPMSAGFWDYSGETPIFRASLRAGLTPTTIALGTDAVETLGFTPLPDQQVESVHIGYNYTDDFGAHTVHNTAGDTPYGYGPNKLHIGVDVETAALASEAQSAGIAPLLYASLSPLAWSGAVNLHETGASLPAIMPGNALSVTGGRAEWETMATVVQTVVWSVSDAANDICTITIGPPERLGPQDYLEFARAGTLAASSAANNPSPWEPPTPPTIDPGDPGTLDDLNGGTAPAAPLGSLLTEHRGATLALEGWDRWGGVEWPMTTPPRVWRQVDYTGTITKATEAYDVFPASTEVLTLSGHNTFSPAANGGLHTYTQSPDQGHNTEHDLVANAYSYSIASTVQSNPVPHEVRYDPVTPWPAHVTAFSGFISSKFSNEETEDTRWTRYLGTAPEWASGDSAMLTVRTSGITFSRYDLRYAHGQMVRIGGTDEDPVMELQASGGYTPWGTYQITVILRRRPVDSAGAPTGDGSYSDWATRTHLLTADIDGKALLDWQYVEAPAGYEVIVGSHTISPYV